MNPLLGVAPPSSPGEGQPQDTAHPTWARLSWGDPLGTVELPVRQRCPHWCPCVVGQAQGHVASAAEQKVWIWPCLAWARAEPGPEPPLPGADALLGHPFWGALLQKAGGALLKVWLPLGH